MTSASRRTSSALELPDQTLNSSDAISMLTVYVLLLTAIPSSVRIAALGSMGRPSMLWGLVLFIWWLLWRVTARPDDLTQLRSPIKLAFFALFAVALISFGAGLLRGQPADQVSPAATSLLRLLSWGGSLLVAMEGLRRVEDVLLMIRRLAMAGWLLAVLGLVQFVTRQGLVDWWGSIPGFETEAGGVTERGGFTRASGTAIHPLEHATALSASLPLAIGVALQASRQRFRPTAWAPVGIIALGSILAVSRSALIGFFVASLASLPALPRRVRGAIVTGGVVLGALAVVAVPGLLSLFLQLFAPSGDASTQSRTNALARLPEFVSESPLFGTGFGTFLPRYYIFDNAWAMMLVELGILGLLAFAALFITSIYSAERAVRQSADERAKLFGHMLSASALTIAVVFAFFDGLSFPIAAGFAFLIFGLCGALSTAVHEETLLATVDTPEQRMSRRLADLRARTRRARSR